MYATNGSDREVAAKSLVTRDVHIFGLPFWNPSYEQFKTWWDLVLKEEGDRSVVVGLANAHTLNQALAHPEFRAALADVDALVNDGIGYRIASKMRGVRTAYNLNGTDLVPRLLRELTAPTSVFLYGASEDSNRGAAEAVSKYENVRLVGRISGYVDPEKEALPAIAAAKPDVLLVALGHPRQEIFCVNHRAQLGAKVCVPVGGLFDFLSHTKPRAPQWMRSTGLEWVYRFWLEPGRMFSRYVLGNPSFLIRSLLQTPRDRALQRAIESSRTSRIRAHIPPLA